MKGIKYPFQISDEKGAPEEAEEDELVASAITQLMSQRKGERPYRPLDGVDLHDYIFEHEEPLIRANVRRELQLGLTRFEPRVRVERVLARFIETAGGGKAFEPLVLWSFRGTTNSTSRQVDVSNQG